MKSKHQDSVKDMTVKSKHLDSVKDKTVKSKHPDSVKDKTVKSKHPDSVKDMTVKIVKTRIQLKYDSKNSEDPDSIKGDFFESEEFENRKN